VVIRYDDVLLDGVRFWGLVGWLVGWGETLSVRACVGVSWIEFLYSVLITTGA
jgi:hypothetical protein